MSNKILQNCPEPENQKQPDSNVHIVRTSGSYNCGGRCLILAHVRDGKVIRITSDEEGPDTPEQPQLRGCLKCRGFRGMLDHPDRLTRPLKRAGKRGEGLFEPVTWDEALDTIAAGLTRIRDRYGPDSIYVNYATGVEARLSENVWMRRLLGLTGGWLSYYGSYSSGATTMATPYTYGTNETGNSRSDWINSKLIILIGWNPADTTFGTNSSWYLKRAREAGARIYVIDPIYTNTAIALADEWIPIRPTTDNALFDAMAYVMVQENLQDQAFLDRFCLGFDEDHMPDGITPGNSYRSYLLGLGPDRTVKTPEWAEAITGIPRTRIEKLAREYACSKPAALIQGFGSQRHANGEQSVRGGTILAAMTGNVGISGGWASGKGMSASSHYIAAVPTPNPNPARISHFIWPEAIRRGHEMGPSDGVRGANRLGSDIKMIFNLGGNCLVNQHSDINSTTEILADTSKVELIVASELFMTASARYADIILPSDNMYERDNIAVPWQFGDEVLFMNKVVDPPAECRNGYDWISDLAGRLGADVHKLFTEGRTLEDWLRWLVNETASRNPGFPDLDKLRAKGCHRWLEQKPHIAFRKQITDPENNPFPTPSGKIEIFSSRLWQLGQPLQIPAVPQYIAVTEGPQDSLRQQYPLQCIGPHIKRRVHSSFDNSAWMKEVEPQALWISPGDAAARGIGNGDRARVFNERGVTVLPAKVTPRIMPGVVAIPQGAWWQPDDQRIDRNGSINVLTMYQPTPLAFSNPSHTCLVEILRDDDEQEENGEEKLL